MPARAITQEVFDALLDAYRQRPGVHKFAARVAGVSPEFARKAWRGDVAMWRVFGGMGIEQHLEVEAENVAAAKNRAKKQKVDHDKAVHLAAEAIEAKKLEDEAKLMNDATLRAARAVVLSGFTGLAKVHEGVNALAKRIGDQLLRGTDAQGNPLVIDPMETMRILQRFAQSTATLTNALDTLTAMERVKQNLPTAIMGIEIANITIEDAERELETAKDAVKRARDLGLVVHQGGRTA